MMKRAAQMAKTSFAGERLFQEGRSMRPANWVLAILMFITTLAAAAALMMATSAHSLSSDLAHRMTVQIVEANPDFRHAQVHAAASLLSNQSVVESVDVVDDNKLDALISPWLGKDGEAAGLPYPSLIDVTLRAGATVDLATLRANLLGAAPSARIEPDAQWLGPLNTLLIVMMALALAIVVLMMVAVAAAVILSTRAALSGHRDTIDILHFMGSSDVQISRMFQRRIAKDALLAGLIGVGGALAILLLIQTPLGAMDSEFIGSTVLSWWGWVLLCLLPFLSAGLAITAAHLSIMRALKYIL